MFLQKVILFSVVLVLVVGDPAQPCDQSKCKLPSCHCASTSIPGGLTAEETPQMIVISFSDGLRVEDYEMFYSKFLIGRSNPNGCPIPLTFFPNHYYSTDYSLVEDLYSQGHEIADQTVTHRSPVDFWLNASSAQWSQEIADMKTILEAWGNVPSKEVTGFRAPFLASSENEIRALKNTSFTYDASMPSRTAYWPFTLDYKSPLCQSPATCPNDSYPGIWVVPNIDNKQSNGQVCAVLEQCTSLQSEDDWVKFFISNFEAHYSGEKAPLGVYATSAFFYTQSYHLSAFVKFLDYIKGMSDVYVVTHTQLIEWMRQPTPLSKIKTFSPWECPKRPSPRCSYLNANHCRYTVAGVQRILSTCEPVCPRNWPDLGNPYGH